MQHRFDGMRLRIEARYQADQSRDAGCFEIDGGTKDSKNHFIIIKKRIVLRTLNSTLSLSAKISRDHFL